MSGKQCTAIVLDEPEDEILILQNRQISRGEHHEKETVFFRNVIIFVRRITEWLRHCKDIITGVTSDIRTDCCAGN